jgi:hypothetical protein
VKLKLLLEEKMANSLVKEDLKHVEEKNSPQVGSPMFPVQITSRERVPMKRMVFEKK